MNLKIEKRTKRYWVVVNADSSDPFGKVVFAARTKKQCIEFLRGNK